MRHLISLVAVVGTFLAVVAVGAQPAAAASTPCGNACDGLDPYAMMTPPGGPAYWYRCADDAYAARTVSQYVQLMYSPRCRTAWAHSLIHWSLGGGAPEIHSYYTNGSHRKAYYGFSPTGDYTLVNTVMVNDAGLLAEAVLFYGSAIATTAPRF